VRLLSKRVTVVGLTVLIGLGAAYYMTRGKSSTDWVDIGIGGPQHEEDFKYRYISIVRADVEKPVSHPDLTRLTLNLQNRSALGEWVYLPIFGCRSPDVRNGVPTVSCETIAGSHVYLGAKDGVREKLLELKNNGDRASVRARAIGLYASTPILWVIGDSPEIEKQAL
jgi:hypothetical protein